MAVNNPLSQIVPAAGMPSAGSGYNLGVAQGQYAVGQSPTGTLSQPSAQPSTSTPGAATPGAAPSAGSITDNPLARPYQNAQAGYYGPLGANPVLGPTSVTDPTLQAIQQKLAAQAASDPILSGKQLPHPASVSVQGHLQPWQVAAETIHGVVDQMVINPVNQIVQAWQHDPRQGLLETALGVGAIGGMVALGAVLPEVALGAAVLGGVLMLPGAISAWSDEVAHPTDQNLVKALVSTSVAGLSLSPIKAFRSLGQARSLLENGLNLAKEATTAKEATSLFLGGMGQAARGLKTAVPLQKQVEVLGMDPETLITQFQKRGINTDEGPAAAVIDAHHALEEMQANLRDAIEAGDKEKASKMRLEIKQFAEGDLADARLQVAYHHVFLPNAPYGHIPLSPVGNVDAHLEQLFEKQAGGIRGILRTLGDGSVFGTGVVVPVAKAAEHLGASRAGLGARYAAQQAYNMWAEMRDKAGITDKAVESIWQAMEDREHWDRLTPNEKAFGQRMRDIVDQVSINNLRQGVISHALQGRAPRYYEGFAPEEFATDPLLQASDWTHEGVRNPHRAWHAAVSEEGEVHYESKPRHEDLEGAKEKALHYEMGRAHRDLYTEQKDAFTKYRRQIPQLKRFAKREGDAGKASQAKLEALQADIADAHGELGLEIALMERGALNKILRALPPSRKLVEGSAVMRKLLYNHAHVQEMASFRNMLESHAEMGLQSLQSALGDLKRTHWGADIALPKSKVKLGEYPDMLPETVFLGDGKLPAEEMAKSLGYYRIHPAIGKTGDLHYRPALYARNELAKDILRCADEATSYADLNRGVMGVFYKLGQLNRRVVMATPFWHGMNVTGRLIAHMVADPSLAGAALKDFARLIHDPEEYHALATEFGLSGGRHADQYEVGQHINRLTKEEDGQGRWPGALRTFQRPISSAYHWQEAGFWRMVDQVQLLGYKTAKARIKAQYPQIQETELRMAAAQYANNLGGIVNPLYMNQVWRQVRGMVWFSPSYWGTFMRALTSAMPGAARLSRFLAQRDSGRFTRLGAVPLRSIDYRTRIELTRMNRDWFTTYMMTSIVSADLMNLIGSGHHIWDNAQGHNFDIDMSNFVPPSKPPKRPGQPQSQVLQPHYIAGVPFFRQGADVANAIGLGHDYGFAHTINDQNWQQLDLAHKTGMLMGSILDGTRRQAANKLAGPIQSGYEAALGEQLSARLGQGVQHTVPRWAALVDLLPAGNVAQRVASEIGQPNPHTVAQDLQAASGALLSQYTGLPSMFQMGAERQAIDDSKFTHWQQERTASQDRMKGFSTSLLNGYMTPVQYVRKKESELDYMDQLNRDTWPDHSNSSTALANARASLKQQYGLLDRGVPDDTWFARYDLFQQAWEQQLRSASPEARAQWWDQSTAQWTDADYLEWESKQLKKSLAASIDGQGGNYIAAYQNQLYGLYSQISRQDYAALENQDPYFSAYKLLLSEMSSATPLGAFVSAWSATQSNTTILPPGFGQADAQAWADYTGKTVVRSEEATALAQQARLMAKEPQVRQAGGESSTPAIDQTVQAVQGG